MRTTLDLDDALLEKAGALARQRSTTLDRVISDLAMKGLDQMAGGAGRRPFPTFQVPPGARTITPDDVKRALDDEE